MVELIQQLYHLFDCGFKMRVADGRLLVNPPADCDDELKRFARSLIEDNKAHIIQLLSNKAASEPILHDPTLAVELAETQLPLSYGQERIRFIDRFEQGSNAYNAAVYYKLSAQTHIDLLERCLQAIVKKHESLHTVIREDEQGRGYQSLIDLDDTPFLIHQVQLDSTDTVDTHLQQDMEHVFALESDFPIHVTLYTLPCATQAYLSIIVHHIAFDGWSRNVFEYEWVSAYNALSASYASGDNVDDKVGSEVVLPPLTIQYRDYAVWQKSFIKSATMQSQINYWRHQLSGFSNLNLYTDKVRPTTIDYSGGELYFEIDAQTSKQLRSLSKQCQVSPFSLLLSAFFLMLKTYSRQDDIVVGTPVANRHMPQVENLIGFFVNTLALRVGRDGELAGEKTLQTYVQSISQILIDAQINQDLPFEKVVEELTVEKDTSRHPVFQVMFVAQSSAEHLHSKDEMQQQSQALGNTIEHYAPVSDGSGSAKFDLTAVVDTSTDNISGCFIYASALFDKSTVEGFVESYLNVLRAFTDCSQSVKSIETVKIKELHCVKASSKQTQLYDWNSKRGDYPNDKTLAQLFEAQCDRVAGRTAVVFEYKQLTYQALNQRANQLANYLIAHYQLQPNSFVALSLQRNEQSIIAILAVLKAGAAYVPLDPELPDERLAYCLADTQAVLLLVNETNEREFKSVCDGVQNTPPILSIDSSALADSLSTHPIDNPVVETQANDLAYAIYTSGTTGQPKGVMVEHKSVSHLISGQSSDFGLKPFDGNDRANCKCFLWYSNYVFDAHVSDVFSSLLQGHELHILSDERRQAPALLLYYLQKTSIDIAFLPPALLAYDTLFPVATIISAGEALDLAVLNRYLANGTKVINAYGPSESTVCSNMHVYEANTHAQSATIIGQPIANATVYVLDEYCQPVPVGATGELYIGGAGVARGYLNKLELTVQHFITNPFQSEADKQSTFNSRLYKTGDLVRWRPDGSLQYIGRNDFQVKLRGYRIELGEIEQQLVGFSGVKQSVVLLQEGAGSQPILVAYYVSTEALDEQAIKAYLRAHLPTYMLPDVFMWLKSIPLTTNGKVNRKALPNVQHSSEAHYVSPSNPVEHDVCAVWSDILNVDANDIGINDNFFDLGGNSILIMMLAKRLCRVTKQENIPIATLFKYPTIKEFVHAFGDDKDKASLKSHCSTMHRETLDVPIAVVGLSGEFSGCDDIEQYWSRLLAGEECIDRLTREEGIAAGIPEAFYDMPAYRPVGGRISDIDTFDANFWGLSAQDAKLMDPQIRKYLQHSWWALEQAGCLQNRSDLRTGVFAGIGSSRYFETRLRENPALSEALAEMDLSRINTHEFMASRVSYLLGLTGLSMHINTACSTSLVAIVEACKNLAMGSCDVGLAGGVRLPMPEEHGYFYQPGMIFSEDGYCRTFADDSSGVISGAGVGVVVLKRLSDAETDGSTILSVIKGYASNNDGHRKVGYTAPSVVGQAECVLAAQRMAGVKAETVGYVECHGTATQLGDPIEVAALHDAFSENATDGEYDCVLGAVKANIGHTDSAAGIAGFIKAHCMLRSQMMPPQIHYQSPNPNLHLAQTQFRVQVKAQAWLPADHPRRAGISSFGIGGTNAHVILQEYETLPAISNDAAVVEGGYLLPLSAHSVKAFRLNIEALLCYLEQHPNVSLADISSTLQHKREAMAYRLCLVCRDVADAITQLRHCGDPIKAAKSGAGVERAIANESGSMNELGDLWETGANVDWQKRQKNTSNYNVVDLSRYVFEPQKYWVDLPKASVPVTQGQAALSLNDKADIYQLAWKRGSNFAQHAVEYSGTWLVFEDDEGVVQQWIAALQAAGCELVVLRHQTGLATLTINDARVLMDGRNESHYEAVAEHLDHLGLRPNNVLHAWSLSAENVQWDLKTAQWQGFYSLYLWQSLIRRACAAQLQFAVLTNGVNQVTGLDVIVPAKGTLLGGLRSMVNETPGLNGCIIDAGYSPWAAEEALPWLSDNSHYVGTANYSRRGSYCWQQQLQIIDGDALEPSTRIRSGDVLMITGGLGGVGLAVAKEIAKHHKLQFVLVNRSGISNANSSRYQTYQKESLEAIKALGCQVDVQTCQLGDAKRTEKMLAHIKGKYGTVNGLIHAAGIAPLAVADRSIAAMDEAFQGKVKGLVNLLQLLKNEHLRYVVLTSSLASWLGDIGRLEYCAANSYLDVYSGAEIEGIDQMLSIQWPGWFDVGLGSKVESQAGNVSAVSNDLLNLVHSNAVSESEGAEIFYRLINQQQYQQLAVSKLNIPALAQALFADDDDDLITPETVDRVLLVDENVSETEKTLAQLFYAVLDCQGISKHDSYFELGGNSLSAIRLVNKINMQFDVNLNVSVVAKYASIVALASYLDDLMSQTELRQIVDEGEL